MRLAEAAMPTFARHETFHPRYGWFRKAYEAAAEEPNIFTREDAPVRIGVGKNMVRSIRFWGLAAKILTEDPESPSARASAAIPTRFGHALFGDPGLDSFLEDPGTLWLLHWRLLSAPCRLPVWWLAFAELNAGEFTEDELETLVTAGLEAAPEWKLPKATSIKKDISALLRTYGPAALKASSRTSVDDLLDCPMRELRLITRSPVTDRLRFAGAKSSLPPPILAFASLDCVLRGNSAGETPPADADTGMVTISRLAGEPGWPGRAFRLSEDELLATLELAVEATPGLNLGASVGSPFLSWTKPLGTLADDILGDYYGKSEAREISGPVGDLPIDDNLLRSLGIEREPSGRLRPLHDADLLEHGARA